MFYVINEGYIPLNLVIDRNMFIRYRQFGYYEDDLEAAVQESILP